MEVNKIISKLYNNAGFTQKYGGQIYLTCIILFVFGIVITYMYVLNHIQEIKRNWAIERCKPFIIPLAGWINNTNKKTESDYKNTMTNFYYCLGQAGKNTFSYIIDPIKYIINGLSHSFTDATMIISGLVNYYMSLKNSIISMLENAWGLALQSVTGMEQLLNKSRDSFNRILGVVITILYSKMLIFRMSILWMIATPVFMMFSMVTSLLVNLIIGCITLQVKSLVMWVSFTVCVAQTLSSCAAQTEALIGSIIGPQTIQAGAAMTEGGAELLPFPTTPAGVAGVAAGAFTEAQGVASVTAAVAGSIYSSVMEVTKSAGCVMSVVSKLFMVIAFIMATIEVTALTVLIYLMFVCLHFVKVTLGEMNIPGQGIPGLSF